MRATLVTVATDVALILSFSFGASFEQYALLYFVLLV